MKVKVKVKNKAYWKAISNHFCLFSFFFFHLFLGWFIENGGGGGGGGVGKAP